MKKVMCLWYGYIIAKHLKKSKILFVRKYQIMSAYFVQLVYAVNSVYTETAHLFRQAVSVFLFIQKERK